MEEEKLKNKKSVEIMTLLIIIILLLGVCVYLLFIKDGKNNPQNNVQDNNTQNNVQDNTQNNQPASENVASDSIIELYGERYNIDKEVTYKSKDGKNELTIIPSQNGYSYSAEYNGKKLSVGITKAGKYLIVSATDYGSEFGQCGKYSYIANLETNTLVDLPSNNVLNIVRLNDKYYFLEETCSPNSTIAVYNEDLNKIGTNYLGTDKKSFYILNGNLIKYNSSGQEIARTSEVFDEVKFSYDDIVTKEVDQNLYILLADVKNVFLIDTRDLKVIKIGTADEYSIPGPGVLPLHSENGKLVIELYNSKNNNEIKMYYDIETKTLSK